MELLQEFSTFISEYMTEDVVTALHTLSGSMENHQLPNISTENLAQALAGLTIEVRRVAADENLSRNMLARLNVNDTLELGIRVFNGAGGRTKAELQMLYTTFLRDLNAFKMKARGSDDLPDRVRYIAQMYAKALGRVDVKGDDNV